MKNMKELRRCISCPRYFWSLAQPLEGDNWNERLKYCSDCWNNRLQKPGNLKEIENENSDIPETEKQRQNSVEEYSHNNDKWRKSN